MDVNIEENRRCGYTVDLSLQRACGGWDAGKKQIIRLDRGGRREMPFLAE